MNDVSDEGPEILYRGRRFSIELVKRAGKDGEIRTCEVIRHPGSVVIVPLLDGDRICLIQNHRVTVNETLIELPAGTREPDENPLVTARRELIEETGFRAHQLELVTSFFPAPGNIDERMYLYVATQLEAGEPQREPNEEIENLIVPRWEALQMVQDGRIKDAKTMLGLLLLG